MTRALVSSLVVAALAACGSSKGDDGDAGAGDGDGGTGGVEDAGGGAGADAPFSGTCMVGGVQCANCTDDDSDGKADGFDPECSGPLDNDESSFATGIPGDNIDDTMQDCFFDGNSGAGNDGCNQHACCLLAAPDQAACAAWAPASNASKYELAECYPPTGTTAVPAKCTMVCGGITPPGCDCFGCCTVCSGSTCVDIALNPQVSPSCDASNITDLGPDATDSTGDEPCKRCVKNSECGNTECGGATCILCPGQDASSLPESCGGQQMCPNGYAACGEGSACPSGTYCANGCCIGTIL